MPGLADFVGKPIGFGTPRYKRFKSELKNNTQPLSSWITPKSEAKTVLPDENAIVSGTNDEGTKALKAIFGAKVFNYPKPLSLIRELIRQASGPGDFVLDFFAGSATTAHAVMELNAKDTGDRRFIMISHDEATETDRERNICRDVTARRIRLLNDTALKTGKGTVAPFAYLRTHRRPIDALHDDGGLTAEDVWLIDRFVAEMEKRGDFTPDRQKLGRVIDQIAVYDQERIRRCIRKAQSLHSRSIEAAPIPAFIEDRQGLFEAHKAAFSVFPSKMNKPERAFAEFIDKAQGVAWWLRNPDHPACPWAVSIVLATGRRFFPDFIIAVEGRHALDQIRLAEVKDDGAQGPLNSRLNLLKEMTGHVDYLDVLWVTKSESESRIERLSYSEDKQCIVSRGHLTEADLR